MSESKRDTFLLYTLVSPYRSTQILDSLVCLRVQVFPVLNQIMNQQWKNLRIIKKETWIENVYF